MKYNKDVIQWKVVIKIQMVLPFIDLIFLKNYLLYYFMMQSHRFWDFPSPFPKCVLRTDSPCIITIV